MPFIFEVLIMTGFR